jgi:hypothetical protein
MDGVLRRGARGPEVIKLQLRLQQTGHSYGLVDGIFGPVTERGVKSFQAANGLLDDGEVGPLTAAALWPHEAPPQQTPVAPLARLALETARSQVGVREQGWNRGPEVETYQRVAGIAPGDPYCCAFVYWAVQQASDQLKVANPLKRTGLVVALWSFARERGWTVPALETVPGDVFVILFARHSDGSQPGHTGFVDRNAGVTERWTVEANTHPESNGIASREGDGVWRRRRDARQFAGAFRLPDIKAATI